ncbi:hypothetical protein NKH77_49175 [Streptomyces sp. M19]
MNLKLRPDEGVMMTQAGTLARDGRSKFGDASADGYARATPSPSSCSNRWPTRSPTATGSAPWSRAARSTTTAAPAAPC